MPATPYTTEQLKKELELGRSLLFNPSPGFPAGRLVTHPDHLPGEAELAQGDPDKEKAALEVLKRRRETLDAEIASLESGAKPAPAKVESAPAPAVPARDDESKIPDVGPKAVERRK